MVKFSIEPWYTLFYWAYAIVWCEVKCRVLSLIYNWWIFTVYYIRIGPLSTPNVRRNPRSHTCRDWGGLAHWKPSWKEEHGKEDLSGPCAGCAHAFLLLLIIYLGLPMIFGGTFINLIDFFIICFLVSSMWFRFSTFPRVLYNVKFFKSQHFF